MKSYAPYTAVYAQLRTELLAIPAEQAPRVHRLKTVAEIQDLLEELIVEALESLTRDAEQPVPGRA